MTIKAELSYLEFHNSKEKLESGFYQVVEADGDLSYVLVKASDWGGPASVKWLSEDEYLDLRRQDQEIIDSWDMDCADYDRINPIDLEEVDHNNNSELFDQVVYGIEPSEYQESTQADYDAAVKRRALSSPKTLGELLREHMSPDVRQMNEAQYAEHCESADQDRRDGVNL